ncbi:MAG: UvrD-helicase domain-containing protein [Saprospiraceae bacterium]
MQLTDEQQAIIASTGDIKINAVAGAGKTTTMLEYAKAKPAQQRLLYLAFNKSVKLEAERRFQQAGLPNVQVETAHSLAFHHAVKGKNYKITPGYKTHQLKEILDLSGYPDKHAAYIIANHVNKFAAYFCNSNADKVQALNYLDTVHDAKAKAFVSHFYEDIQRLTRVLLAKMENREIDITHDFYLKKFQLAQPKLPYDYILFDEGQDASGAMLDVFTKQKAGKVIVGDTHQQIYGWRYAINSLEKVDFQGYRLSTSFRFDPEIALLASRILDWKKHFVAYESIPIIGAGRSEALQSRATIARTNLFLLVKAIELAVEKREVQNLYFEGNIHSYTYADEGASIYDVLHLYNGKPDLIRDQLVKSMQSMLELEEYIEKTEDAELGMMLEIVNKYGKELPYYIKEVKDRHVTDDAKDRADMIFSTVHRCKGMEYDEVTLENDFIKEADIIKRVNEAKHGELDAQKLAEEVNLLYVAATRTKNRLNLPQALMPPSKINIIPPKNNYKAEKSFANPFEELGFSKQRSLHPREIRQQPPGSFQPWSADADEDLMRLYDAGMSIKDLAKYFDRTTGAIVARLKRLNLE